MSYIVIRSVSYTYSGRVRPAVKEVSLAFDRGEKIAVCGLNGSGKSTLAKLIMGILKPQKGRIFLDGVDSRKHFLWDIGKKLGYIMQTPTGMFFNPTVREEVDFCLKWNGCSPGKETPGENYLKYFNIWHLREEIPFNLSEGEKQLVALSAVLALRPQFLVLDEPTKTIDSHRKEKLQEVLQDIWARGTGLILISHDREFVSRFGGRKVEMERGEVVQ